MSLTQHLHDMKHESMYKQLIPEAKGDWRISLLRFNFLLHGIPCMLALLLVWTHEYNWISYNDWCKCTLVIWILILYCHTDWRNHADRVSHCNLMHVYMDMHILCNTISYSYIKLMYEVLHACMEHSKHTNACWYACMHGLLLQRYTGVNLAKFQCMEGGHLNLYPLTAFWSVITA